MKCTGNEWDTCRVEKMGCIGCHYSEADDMFKELGYEILNNNAVFYEIINKNEKVISFKLENKTVSCYYYYDGIENISMQELRAINKKCIELGWVNQ